MMMMKSTNQMSLSVSVIVGPSPGARLTAEDVAEGIRQGRDLVGLQGLERLGSRLDLRVEQVEEEHEEDRVQDDEHDQREEDVRPGENGRPCLRGLKDVVDDPRLPSDLGRPPASG